MEAKAFPMNSGDGAYSYTKNSYYQRAASYAVKEMLEEAIAEKFDVTSLSSSSNTIRIADLGCSIGPNTFITMQNLIESMERKCHSQDRTNMPEFHLFFNDHASNDFNTLFSSLPPGRHYFAAGVPGSFHGRLFPKSSLHFVHSSYALHWLSKVPEDLLDKSSPAWNKGRIHCKNASEQVANAYANQFAKDMEVFLDARADEIAVGGMMVVIMPAHPEGDRPSQSMARVALDFIEQSFVDMVKVGSISEAELDSFNLPLYSPSLKEMTQLVQSNGCFSIESMELTDPLSKIVCPLNIRALVMHLRAVLEGIFTKHFGSEIIDELFERTLDKFAEFSSLFESCCGQQDTQLFLVLKRK
ncbi:S-adenosyl-L-methionine-dependent methyltransferases superfamily protein [Actinidia rufa]|uniref:S-adenosyl-L-methionine-dependent methyltransferases superfamily protein n=1 Tax=Actinidia rufa TaxID=165716 RepID=A0A7J0HF02_9ERIC|nr:S-adenosyl-L-methionine-dependent methyltransferases superfamily protein [Actinidia rufa]